MTPYVIVGAMCGICFMTGLFIGLLIAVGIDLHREARDNEEIDRLLTAPRCSTCHRIVDDSEGWCAFCNRFVVETP